MNIVHNAVTETLEGVCFTKEVLIKEHCKNGQHIEELAILRRNTLPVAIKAVAIGSLTHCVLEYKIRVPNPDKEGFGDLERIVRRLYRTPAGRDFKKFFDSIDKKELWIAYTALKNAKSSIEKKRANLSRLNRKQS